MSPTTAVPEATLLDGSVSRQLRAATRDEHRASEAALDLASLTTPAALAALLQGWVSVWLDVARAANGPASCSTARAELLRPATLALDWLAVDLADLAVVAGRGDRRCRSVTPSTDRRASVGDHSGGFSELLAVTSSSWGVAYVLGGSRLGGAVLAPVLSKAVRLPDAIGTTFLRSASTDPGREWVAFRRRLDSLEISAEQLAVAVDAARWTFDRVGAELSARHREHQATVP